MRDAPDEAAVALEFSEDEKRVLALYDQLRNIRLEIALLKARESFKGGMCLGILAFLTKKRIDVETILTQ